MMSEKRFSLEYCDNMSYVKDNFNDNEYYLYWAVELMNELYEENGQLRKENVFLAKQRSYWKSKCAEWMGVKEENLSLRCVNMSEKRFKTKYYLKGKQGVVLGVVKVNEEENVLHWNDVVDLLNEQDEKIKKLHRAIHINDELDKEKLEALKDAETETKLLNSYLVEKGLAEEYIRWKGDD